MPNQTLLSWFSSLLTNASKTLGQASYQVNKGRLRSGSIFNDENGVEYVPAEELGKGRAGVVRKLVKKDKNDVSDTPELVVKKNLPNNTLTKPVNLDKAQKFLKLVYPEYAEYIHVFDQENTNRTRMVMPKLGEKTLASILRESEHALNFRYAHIVEALNTLIDLREQKGIYHNDAHGCNILFDSQGRCYLIDGERFTQVTNSEHPSYHHDADLDKFAFNARFEGNLQDLYIKLQHAGWEYIKKYQEGRITYSYDEDKKVITYHLIDFYGNCVSNTITENDCIKLLNADDYQTMHEEVFNNDLCSIEEKHLKIILEITSKRLETGRDATTFFSPNFLSKLGKSQSLNRVREVYIEEMKINHEIVIGLIQDLHHSLKDLMMVMLQDNPWDERLSVIQESLEKINVDHDTFPFTEKIISGHHDDVLHELLGLFYQMEKIAHVSNYKAKCFLIFKTTPMMPEHLQAHDTKIREMLRCHMVHLPELLKTKEQVLAMPEVSLTCSMKP